VTDFCHKETRTGRPLSLPVRTFVAVLLSKVRGIAHKTALELIEEDPDAAPGLYWSLAAVAHAEGMNTREEFEAWLRDALSEQLHAPRP
jgi:hypothetical protein